MKIENSDISRFKKQKKTDLSGTKTAYLPKELIEFVEKNGIDYSAFVREKLTELKNEYDQKTKVKIS